MRKFITAAMLLSSTSVIFAQKELPAFGKIDKAEFLSTECEFGTDSEKHDLVIKWLKPLVENTFHSYGLNCCLSPKGEWQLVLKV